MSVRVERSIVPRNVFSGLLAMVSLILPCHAGQCEREFTLSPSQIGTQFVRISLPFRDGALREGEGLEVRCQDERVTAGMRPLTWHPKHGRRRSVRRGLVSFPWEVRHLSPIRFSWRPLKTHATSAHADLPVSVLIVDDRLQVSYTDGPAFSARLIAPARSSSDEGTTETVEANVHFSWQRLHLPDPSWPRVIEMRIDSLGTVVLVAHVQRRLDGDGWTPSLGWEVSMKGEEQTLEGAGYRITHPLASLRRSGRLEVKDGSDGGSCHRYLAYLEEEKVPMQPWSWRRVEVVISPAGLAPMGPTLEYPHRLSVAPGTWEALYDLERSPDLLRDPSLQGILAFHREAVCRSVAVGDDAGNVTSYAEGKEVGDVYGMNRLNHCPAIFQESWRASDRALRDSAVLWCENFFDQSIWWGPGGTGGTRYNNSLAQGKDPFENDRSYMWRSNDAVHFCTKGYDAFFLAYEQTGDPRMLEALEAQIRYSRLAVHADQGECRNVGDVREFVRLTRYTGEEAYLQDALRLFRELKSRLSEGDLFSQSGAPIEEDPPFIDDDETGYKHPFAKPYIIGYALAGLPELLSQAKKEPELKEVVKAVADFLVESQDPAGGWRYPHPRSSCLLLNQAMEHAWQIKQAAEALGPKGEYLDAIEKVLRQRILGWERSGTLLSSIEGWEMASGLVKDRKSLYSLYAKPEDRDRRRDYGEGNLSVGSSPPEGLVYFPEVLAFYLKHRPLSRLLAQPASEEPLGQILERVAAKPPG